MAKFIIASRAGLTYNLDQICYYKSDDNKVKIHLTNGESKDLEGEDARAFLLEIGHPPIAPSQAA